MIQTNFNDLEALEIAIQIEKRGENFYKQVSSLTDDYSIKAMLGELAEQERDHAATFQKIYNELSQSKEDFDDTYLYEPEVSAYLRAMTESSVFPSEARLKEIVDGLRDIKDVLTIGIQAEKDSILFYTEMTINARYIAAKDAFRRLLKEEKEHLIDLQTKLKALK